MKKQAQVQKQVKVIDDRKQAYTTNVFADIMEEDGKYFLLIRSDITDMVKGKELPLSSSGKTFTIGNTGGVIKSVAVGAEALRFNCSIWADKEEYTVKTAKTVKTATVKTATVNTPSPSADIESRVSAMEAGIAAILAKLSK